MIDLGNFYSVINFPNSVADCEFLLEKQKEILPHRELNPGLLGESQVS